MQEITVKNQGIYEIVAERILSEKIIMTQFSL